MGLSGSDRVFTLSTTGKGGKEYMSLLPTDRVLVVRDGRVQAVEVGDPYFAYVTSLLHLTSSLSDQKGLVWTATNASIALAPDGTPALSLLGTAGNGLATTANAAAFDFGTGDFTVEMWIWCVGTQLTQAAFLSSGGSAWNAGQAVFRLETGSIAFFINGSTFRRGGAVPIGQWVHVAVCRASGTCRLFVNGVLSLSFSEAANATFNTSGTRIGGNAFDSTTSPFKGFIKNFRATKGYARYTANFTPPTALPSS